MPAYKLYYFKGRGLADVSRQLFSLADVEFEDIRIEHADWTDEKKKEMPFGQMPVLDTNGVKIPQSMAIARYLARKFGYAGKSDEEQAIVDALADQFKDFYAETRTYYYTQLGFMNFNLDEERTKTLIPARDKFLTIVTKYLKNSKSGFLVDGGVTYADLIIVDNMRTLFNRFPEYADNYPEVKEWYQRVQDIPAIQRHHANAPKTDF